MLYLRKETRMKVEEIKKYPIYARIRHKESDKEEIITIQGSLAMLQKTTPVNGQYYLDEQNGNIYRFTKTIMNGVNYEVPIVTYDEDKQIWVTMDTKDSYLESMYHISNCFQVDLETIADAHIEQPLISKELLQRPTSTTNNQYIPINKGDDFLKRLIKNYFIAHRKTPSSVKLRLSYAGEGKPLNTQSYANIMTALRGDTKLSTTYFLRLVNALGANYESRIWDGEYKDSPPENKVLRYTSWDDSFHSDLPLTIPMEEEEDSDTL